MRSDFYVYALLDTRKPGQFKYKSLKFDFEPFYIGKGYGKRAHSHLRPGDIRVYEKRIRNNFKTNKIQSIRRSGYEPEVHIIRDNLSELKAFDLECRFIAKIGRKAHGGPLTNATDGGEGTSGYKFSEEQLKLKGASHKAWYASLSDEERVELNARRKVGQKSYFENLTEEEWELRASKVSEGHKKRTPKQQKEISKRYKDIQRNLPEDIALAKNSKTSKGLKTYFATLSEEERAEHSKKTGAGIKKAWDNISTNKRKARVAKAAAARHTKDEAELQEINSKIATSVKASHDAKTSYEKRMHNFRIMCATNLSIQGLKHDDGLRKRVYAIGERFYKNEVNLEIEPRQLRDRVMKMIDRAKVAQA